MIYILLSKLALKLASYVCACVLFYALLDEDRHKATYKLRGQ